MAGIHVKGESAPPASSRACLPHVSPGRPTPINGDAGASEGARSVPTQVHHQRPNLLHIHKALGGLVRQQHILYNALLQAAGRRG